MGEAVVSVSVLVVGLVVVVFVLFCVYVGHSSSGIFRNVRDANVDKDGLFERS